MPRGLPVEAMLKLPFDRYICASQNEENSEMCGELHNKQLLIPTIYYFLLIHSTIHSIIFFTVQIILDKAIIIIVYSM